MLLTPPVNVLLVYHTSFGLSSPKIVSFRLLFFGLTVLVPIPNFLSHSQASQPLQQVYHSPVALSTPGSVVFCTTSDVVASTTFSSTGACGSITGGCLALYAFTQDSKTSCPEATTTLSSTTNSTSSVSMLKRSLTSAFILLRCKCKGPLGYLGILPVHSQSHQLYIC